MSARNVIDPHQEDEVRLLETTPNPDHGTMLSLNTYSAAAPVKRTASSSKENIDSADDDDDDDGADDENVEIIGQYGTDIWRIPVMFAYVMIMACKAYMWISFSTIIDSAKDFYDISTADVNTIAVTYNYCYLAGFWIPGLLFPRVGLKWGLVLASGLCMTGALCRLLTIYALYKNYTLLVVGNVFAGMCQVIVLAAPPLVSNTWFPANERPIATAVGSAAVFLGGGFGLLLPTFFVNKDHQGKSDFEAFHWFSFCFASFGFLCMVFLPKAPRISPSPAALKQHNDVVTTPSPKVLFASMKRTLRTMFTDVNFLLLMVMTCASVGVCWELPALIPQMAKPFGVSSSSAGWAGFACQGAGFLATSCIGVILTKTKNYKKVLLILSVGCLVSVVVFLSIFAIGMDTISYQGATATTIICWISVMVFASAAFPLCFEIMVEVTFPISESICCPVLIFLTSLASLAFTEGFGAVLGEAATRMDAVIVLAGDAVFLLLGVVAVSFMAPRYKRREYEERVHEHSAPDATLEDGVEETVRTSKRDGRQYRVRRSVSNSQRNIVVTSETTNPARHTSAYTRIQ